MSSKLTGDWKGAQKKLSELDDSLSENLKIALLQNAEMVRTKLVQHIENQDLGWAKLDDDYLERKKRAGLSQHKLIATSTLMNSITVHQVNDESAFVGVLRTAPSQGGDQVMIGSVMEYGSPARNIPARPLFGPTFKEAKPEIEERFRKAIEKSLS